METKSRSAGATTQASDDQPVEDLSQAHAWLDQYARQHAFLTDRKARLEDLMGRKSARRWGPEKKAKMVRRFVTASKEATEVDQVIDLIKNRISQSVAGLPTTQ